jgi:hypothetical protein
MTEEYKAKKPTIKKYTAKKKLVNFDGKTIEVGGVFSCSESNAEYFRKVKAI